MGVQAGLVAAYGPNAAADSSILAQPLPRGKHYYAAGGRL